MYFPSTTQRFVALRSWSSGTTKYGYGDTADAAILDSEAAVFTEAFGASEVKVLQRTEKTKRIRKVLVNLYE